MSASPPILEPTLLEKIALPIGILSTLFYGIFVALTAPFRGESGASTYKSHIGHAMIRKGLSYFSVAQLQYMSGSFISKYVAFCKKTGQEPDVVTLKSGVQVLWMGKRDADYVCLYFHGGGYTVGGDDGHLIYWHSVQKELATSGKSLSFLYVAYSLAPQVSYPGQLCECVEALEYLLDGCGRKPSEILLAGDSAGANMVLAILSHLSHPAPDATPIQLDQPVKAAILCSPWVSFSIDWPSIKKNAHKDILWAPYELIWASNYMGGRDLDNYSEPIRTDTKWWEKVRVEQLLCVAGADEAFVDQIDAFMKVYMGANPKTTTYVVAKNEVHIQPIFYSPWASAGKTEQGAAIESFLKKVL